MTLPPFGTLTGSHDVLLLTLDTLRHDVAVAAMAAGETPNLAALLPGGWEERHAPASFTYAAHKAFFAGFLPTPVTPGAHPRPFALAFPGSESTGPSTLVLDGSDIVTGFAQLDYRTICIGGVGFFDPATPLGADLTAPFEEVWWSTDFGVTAHDCFHRQVELLGDRIAVDDPRPRFVFVNVASLHQPNCGYLPGATADDVTSHRAALAYVDSVLPLLITTVTATRPCAAIICSDHGTAYGEDGYRGHRIGHPVVWTVPYGETVLQATA